MELAKLQKRFSVGLTLRYMTPEEYQKIIDQYEAFIDDIYFSPPYGKIFHTRQKVAEALQPSPAIERTIFQLLEYALKKGITINIALNTRMLHRPDVLLGAFRRVRQHVDISRATTLLNYAPLLREVYPQLELICSYNEGVKTRSKAEQIAKSQFFKTVVLGNAALRDFELFNYIKCSGMDVKLLINNGCSFECNAFCSPSSGCKRTFEKGVQAKGIDRLYAEQSIFPWELHKYYVNSELVDVFKISNRPASYQWLVNCLQSYIRNLNRDVIKQNYRNYHYWARLGHFSKYYNTLNYECILTHKNKIWAEIHQNL